VHIWIDMTDRGNNQTDVTGNASVTTQVVAFLDSGWLVVTAVEFYIINYAVIGVAIFGTAANAVVFYALIVHNARQAKKRIVNLLIINQNLLDLCCCVTIVVCLSFRVSSINLTSALGNALCSIFLNENLATCFLSATVINLIALTIERYLKVVYPFWSKKHLKSWMIHASIVFSWIAGIISVGPVGYVTSFVVDGVCVIFYHFDSAEIRKGYMVWNFFSFFLLPLIVFVYCYGHIVVVMRKQMRVMAGHNVERAVQSASQAQSKRAKWNVIKTMIIVSVFFTICWCPVNVYVIVMDNLQDNSERIIGYVVCLCLPYVNISLNPFIYATKHEGVKTILTRMTVCHKRDEDSAAVVGKSGAIINTSDLGTKKDNKSVLQ